MCRSMKSVASIFALAFLSLALVLTGPTSRGVAASDTMMVELCLDGVVQVVRLGRDGQPVTPNQGCGQTHACCIIADDPALPGIVPDVTVLFLEQTVAPEATDALISRSEYLFADPRGPPAAQIGQIHQLEIRS